MTELHVNHKYLLEQAEGLVPQRGAILDFGCGKGDLVAAAVARRWDGRGVEYFGPGSGTNIRATLEERGLLHERVLPYDGSTVPFSNERFDVVTANQVFEHVPDLERALNEIVRVLRPGGWLLCSFPSRDTIREGHCNVPFAHWLPESRARFLLLLGFRALGVGRLKRNRTRLQWAHFFNGWLSENTFYRRETEIRELFRRRFAKLRDLEADYAAYRLDVLGRHRLASLARGRAAAPAAWMVRRFGSLVIGARKG